MARTQRLFDLLQILRRHRRPTVTTELNFVLLYVDNPQLSAAFYARLLGVEPVESSPTFALLALKSGVMLGLWPQHTVEPPVNGKPAASELAFSVEDSESVRELYKKWGELKLRIAQAPTELDFGFTFVAHCGAQCGSNAARFTRPLSREHARSHFITSSIQC